MYGKFRVTFQIPADELIDRLKRDPEVLKLNLPGGFYFENFEDREHLQLKLRGVIPAAVAPYRGAARIVDNGNTCMLEVSLFMNYYVLFLVGSFIGYFFYTVVQLGIKNFGSVGFIPSITIPAFLMVLMIGFWFLMFNLRLTKRVKRNIIKYIKENRSRR